MVNILESGKLLTLRPQLAQLIGLNEALFLGQIHFWLERSNHQYDGHTWVYNTVEQWQKQFLFWSYSTVKRTINSLREQGLIHTTDQYNRLGIDRRLWYTIDYEKLSTIGTPPPMSNDQPPVTSNPSLAQNELFLDVEMDNPVGQDEPIEQAHVEHSLYRTENTQEISNTKDQTTTNSTLVVADNLGALPSEPSSPSECMAPEPNCPLSIIHCQLNSHGLSEPVALALTQQYPNEYLQEKISYLEYQLDRQPNMTNPAGWLRCAIQQDYSPPPGYHAAQKAAAEKEKWRAIAEENQRQILESIGINPPENGTLARTDESGEPAPTLQPSAELRSKPCNSATFTTSCHAPQKVQGSRPDSNPTLCDLPPSVSQPCNSATLQPLLSASQETPHPCSPVSVSQKIPPLIQAWEKGYNEVAEFMPIGNLLQDLQQSLLLSLQDGHATIGVKCQYALQRLQMRGKHALRNALSFAMGDLLQGRRASYELVLV